MIGAGPVAFALMPYVISNAKPDKNLGGHVELNPRLIAVIFGCEERDIERAIEYLCSPDPKSRTPDHEGRRLIKHGPFDYQVVNFEKYRSIKDEEERREQNRIAQERWRRRQRIEKGDPKLDPKTLNDEERETWRKAVERNQKRDDRRKGKSFGPNGTGEIGLKDINDNANNGVIYGDGDAL